MLFNSRCHNLLSFDTVTYENNYFVDYIFKCCLPKLMSVFHYIYLHNRLQALSGNCAWIVVWWDKYGSLGDTRVWNHHNYWHRNTTPLLGNHGSTFVPTWISNYMPRKIGGMDKWFLPIHYYWCNYLSMLGLKWILEKKSPNVSMLTCVNCNTAVVTRGPIYLFFIW